MPRRWMVLSVLSAILLLTLVVSLSSAADIDEELGRLLARKSASETIPVLMIFHDLPEVDRQALLHLKDPQQRREQLIAQLKPQALRKQQAVMDVLNDPAKALGVSRVRQLYLAGAIAFEGTPATIEALAAQNTNATLFHDQTYELAAGTRRPETQSNVGLQPRTLTEALGTKTGPSSAATDTAWSVKYINAPKVWGELGYTGSGIVVGHIDSGILLGHSDLAGRIWVNPGEIAGNGLDDDGNGFIDDIHGWDFGVDDNDPNDDSLSPGHGTHTAGTVAGDGSGGTVTGVAPGVRLMAMKVWQADGSGGTLSMIWAAQQYCVENGARVMTMSLGLPGNISDTYRRNDRFNADNIRSAGLVLFNSAGNEHFVYDPPIELSLTARIPSPWSPLGDQYSHTSGVVTVGGTGYLNDFIYNSSSRGPAEWGAVDPWNDFPYNPGPGLIKPDVSAPGVGINSTILTGGYSGDTWSGTSMACPHVAGVAALMLEKNPSLSPAGIDSLMQLNAVDLGPVGKDNDFGAGRIDAYAMVQAVPAVSLPDLVAIEILPDFDGDDVLDPGEMALVAFRVENVSPVQDALTVSAALAVAANPYVSVTDASGVFPAILQDGGTGENQADAFELAIDAAAPQGYEFTLLLTVSDGSGFQRTFDIPWYVGLPDFRTHNVGSLYLSITDQGSIGYMDQTRAMGEGIGYLDGESSLYVASFWAGTDQTYVCNRDFGGDGGDPAEWERVENPNGRVRDLGTQRSDQTYRSIFSDSGHTAPRQLIVEQNSLAFAGEPNDDFVILEYVLTNEGATAMPSLYTGVFCDFDILDSDTNEGGTDPSRGLTYMFSAGGPYYGIARLGGAAHNLTMISNPDYIYPLLYVENSFKMRHLSGVISLAATDQPDDWSALTSAVVNLPAEGGTATVAYALVYGADLADLQANVDAANSAYDQFAPNDPDSPTALTALKQNHPNPFNPITSIRFHVAREGHVDLAVYDVAGKRLKTLVAETRPQGEHEVLWDGTDRSGARVPSGIYFYRYVAGGQVISKKMTLVK